MSDAHEHRRELLHRRRGRLRRSRRAPAPVPAERFTTVTSAAPAARRALGPRDVPSSRPRRSRPSCRRACRPRTRLRASSTAADEIDTGLRPIAVSVRARLPSAQGLAERARRARAATAPSSCAARERAPDLTEDLGLADDHRIDPRGDAEQMRDRGIVVIRVQLIAEVLRRDVTELGEEVAQVLRATVELGNDARRPRCGCRSRARHPRGCARRS